MWKNRKIGGPLSEETINKIKERISLKRGVYSLCFCEDKIIGRNLCSKHYQWYYEHKNG